MEYLGNRNSDSGVGSWQEYNLSIEDEEYDADLAQQMLSMRQALKESLTFSPLAKQMLVNHLDGFEHLAAILKKAESRSNGYLSEENRDRLDRYRECLCNNMTLDDDVYGQLVEERVLSKDLVEELRLVGTRRRQCATLLDLLKLLGERAFSGFCAALHTTGQGFLVDTLKSNIAYDENARLETTAQDCPSLDRHLSEQTEHIVLPISCFPKSSLAIMVDITVAEGGRPLLDEQGRPQSRMNQAYTMALIKNRVRLCRELFAELIFDSLLEDEILTSDVTEALFLVGTRHRINQVLLYILPFYGDAAYESFVAALKKTGQDHLATLLDTSVTEFYKNQISTS